MEINTENIVRINAISPQDLKKVTTMYEQNFSKEKNYQILLQIATNLLKKDLLTKSEYLQIKEKCLKKYNPILSTLLAEIA